MGEQIAMLVSEQRRYPQLSYKSDIIFISGLDDGDRRALDKQYRGNDPPCQLDPEDDRFVLKGARFNPLNIINVLTKERGYKMMYSPQQHGIPLKQGSTDDKFALIYHLSKPLPQCQNTSTLTESAKAEPSPPPRVDSLPANPPDITSQVSIES